MLTKDYRVAAIKQGSVIDHLPAGSAHRIIQLLKLLEHDRQISVGMNLPSSRMGLKDLVKIEDRTLTAEEANQVAILAPNATVSLIEGYEVARKFTVELPEELPRIVVCPNPNCITNHESLTTGFRIRRQGAQVQLICRHCRKRFSQETITQYTG